MKTLIVIAAFIGWGLLPGLVEFLAPYAWTLPLIALGVGVGMCLYAMAVDRLDRHVHDRFLEADRRFAKAHRVGR